jgi:methylase of polypeptide subunit release factors
MVRRTAGPRSDDHATIARLRAALEAASFDIDHLKQALGASDDSLTLTSAELPFVSRRLGDGALGTLARLFVLGAPVAVAVARRALAPLVLEQAEALGIIASGRDRAHGLVQLMPTNGLIVASDLQRSGEIPADHVMGVGASSRFLAGITIRRPIALAVDLGTGCGIQALLAARHATRVIATDVNPRAIQFASFNAALNSVGNVEWRLGDLFEPLRGVACDLLVANPPYVISPERKVMYRESPLDGDGISRMIVETAAAHLRDGGIAQVLASWVHERAEDWDAPLRGWVDRRGCDAWLIHAWTRDPHDYAALWNRDLASDPASFARAVDSWVEHLHSRKVLAVSYGAVILRRRQGPVRIRVDEMGAELGRDASDELAWLMWTDDQLESLDDAKLLDRKVVVAPDVKLEQRYRWDGERFTASGTTIALDRGLTPSAEIDPIIVAFLAQADGRSTVRDVLERLAETMPEHRESQQAAALSVTRSLLATGFLRLVDDFPVGGSE